MPNKASSVNLAEQMVTMLTVSDFSQLFSHQHILALIIFSLLVGLATHHEGKKSMMFQRFLQAGEVIFLRFFSLIMYVAPIGFFAYFAVLVHEIGLKLLENYARIALVYYGSAIFYYIVFYSLMAFMAAKKTGFKLFWKNILVPSITAFATCSSAASIPANLLASRKMKVTPEIGDTAITLGSLIHKDGSVIGGMFKIAFLFGIFHLDFSGGIVLITAIGISILVGTVMGAIPSGGMLGEILILSVYGFPPSVLFAVGAISIIIDPLATMLNVTGNTVSSMLIARLVEGKNWCTRK